MCLILRVGASFAACKPRWATATLGTSALCAACSGPTSSVMMVRSHAHTMWLCAVCRCLLTFPSSINRPTYFAPTPVLLPLPAGPCVVLASPGMLQSGFSRQLFDRWAEDPRNGVVLAGAYVAMLRELWSPQLLLGNSAAFAASSSFVIHGPNFSSPSLSLPAPLNCRLLGGGHHGAATGEQSGGGGIPAEPAAHPAHRCGAGVLQRFVRGNSCCYYVTVCGQVLLKLTITFSVSVLCACLLFTCTAAHADSLQTSAFVDALAPPCIILVHGEKSEMRKLRDGLAKRMEAHVSEGGTPRYLPLAQVPLTEQLLMRAPFPLALRFPLLP